jgi:hypothetical protein
LGDHRFARDFGQPGQEPDVQVLDERLGLFLSNGTPFLGAGPTDRCFDLVERRDPPESAHLYARLRKTMEDRYMRGRPFEAVAET